MAKNRREIATTTTYVEGNNEERAPLGAGVCAHRACRCVCDSLRTLLSAHRFSPTGSSGGVCECARVRVSVSECVRSSSAKASSPLVRKRRRCVGGRRRRRRRRELVFSKFIV